MTLCKVVKQFQGKAVEQFQGLIP